MSQRYDSQSGDPEDTERARLEQEEMLRQLSVEKADLGPDPKLSNGTSEFPYTAPKAGQDLSSGFGENHAGKIGAASSAASGASTGATIGSIVPGFGTALGAAAGGIVGSIKGLVTGRHNDTKNEREEFAQSLGAGDSNALWTQLGDKLPPDQANELRDRALNRIGKHDTAANAQWMQDVQSALSAAPAKQTQAAPAAAPAPSASAVPGASAAAPAASAPPAGGYGKAPSGYDQTKWDNPNSDSAKYIMGRGINYAAMRQIPDEAGRKAFLAQEIERMKPELEKAGWTVTGVKGDRAQIGGHGYAPGWVDLVGDIEGAAIPSYQTEDGADHVGPSDRAGMSDGAVKSLVPTDTNFYNELQKRLTDILGGPAAFDREEMLRQLTGK